MPTRKAIVVNKGRKRRHALPDDRRQFLATLDAGIIKAVKSAALDDERSASAILEEAARQWLVRRKATLARKS
jgi:hypothetical protein